jgi:hypothetical protein
MDCPKADASTYDAPGRLRQFDLFILDESSQIDDDVFQLLIFAILEMPHKPFVVLAGDFSQLQPVSTNRSKTSKSVLQNFAEKIKNIQLLQHEFARSKDPVLMDFLRLIRTKQPMKSDIQAFFGERALKGCLGSVVTKTIALELRTKKSFIWLTVTNAGAARVNNAVLQLCYSLTTDFIEAHGFPGDTSAGADRIIVKLGMRIRLTRNIDKDKGFVNGALGSIISVLSLTPPIFVMRLTHGALVLVHPITQDGSTFLPCAYGYAMTIRTLDAYILFYYAYRNNCSTLKARSSTRQYA